MTMVFRLSNIRLQDLLTQKWGARRHAPSFCFFPHFLQPLFFFFFYNSFKELKYYQNIFNTQSFVVWQRAIMLF